MAFLCSCRAAFQVDIKIFLCGYFQLHRLLARLSFCHVTTRKTKQTTYEAGCAAANAACIAQVSTFSICQSMLKTVPVLTCRLTLFCKYKSAATLLNMASHTHFPFSSLVLQVVLSFRGSCFLLAQRMQKPEREKALLSSTP